jgi:uncharacterized protein (TIGR02302 family)
MTYPADNQTREGDRTAVERGAMARVDRVVRRARVNLLWESVWPILAPFVVLTALFVAISWLGVWRIASTPVRYAILAAFVVAAAYFIWRITGFAMPGRAAAFARVEQATGAPHRPATSFADRLPVKPADAATEALWVAHRRRVLAALNNLRAGIPAPRLAVRDPYAVRFLVALLLIVGFVVAGPERVERLAEAWRGGESTAQAIARIDAWVTPPAYTGRAPIFLTGENARPAGTTYSVPVGSVVTIRTGGGPELDVRSVGPVGEVAITPTQVATGRIVPGETPPQERLVTLRDPQNVVVRKGGRDVTEWRFTVIPDALPKIALVGEPKVNQTGSLDLTYALEDDYGVVAAYGKIEPIALPDARPPLPVCMSP